MENYRCVIYCKHYQGSLGCEAYPLRIPDEILEGKDDHLEKRKDQENDIVFEPIEKG